MIYEVQRPVLAVGARARPVPPIGRGGQWTTNVRTTITPVKANQGDKGIITVYIKNVGGQKDKFRVLVTLGKFAPEDYAPGGPLRVGGKMKFYWGVDRTPNPGNLATYDATTGGRYGVIELLPNQDGTLRFVTAPLAPITDYTGAAQNVLDAHIVCAPDAYPEDFDCQWADLHVFEVAVVAPPKGEITNVVYTL